MKILVFEYITGGGFNKQALPAALVAEGLLMLNGLLDGLTQIQGVDVVVMLDWRVCTSINSDGMRPCIITPDHQTLDELERLALQCDVVWPIAPEFDGILQKLCQRIEALRKPLLTSPAKAVALTGNKWQTFQKLTQHKIATVATQRFEDFYYQSGEWMIKAIDGAGCSDSYLVTDLNDFELRSGQLAVNGQFIVQPHIHGEKTSLSCLFKAGRGWLLSANVQKFNVKNQQYHLQEILVNVTSDVSKYQRLVVEIAMVFPDLWGYVGIDLIETADAIYVLEINPRLTTSFVAIQAALGINPCQCVLDLRVGEPLIYPQCNVPVIIKIPQDNHEI
ncbi:MAG: ATP-grasp domain-containing protein [Methylococcaceae bacterium]|nr:ATP-grasp domain-containing protein [Methylococcaceae bacterium]